MSNFQPYIAVITDFKRTNQSIVTLASLSSKRRLELTSVASNANIPATIRHHYIKNDGLCSIFGKITRYHHFHSEYEYTVYGVSGEKIGAGTTKKQVMESGFIA